MEANKKLEDLNKELFFIGAYDKREQERMINNTKMKSAELKGLETGMKKGLEQGLERGKKEIAQSMLSKNLDINLIVECTGLTKEEIQNL